MKVKFLVAYDYDCGGIWRVIDADGKSQILEKYPELIIVDEKPHWMSDERLADLTKNAISIENSGDTFFKSLVSQRSIDNDS
ncbi:hypothetical protein PN836_010270 [Ningiella sp. W23]|uniref:hypothetical protein n=1 Tax=Ningiella sp. W23 TaxID=3023715 RepID=UPI0037571B22